MSLSRKKVYHCPRLVRIYEFWADWVWRIVSLFVAHGSTECDSPLPQSMLRDILRCLGQRWVTLSVALGNSAWDSTSPGTTWHETPRLSLCDTPYCLETVCESTRCLGRHCLTLPVAPGDTAWHSPLPQAVLDVMWLMPSLPLKLKSLCHFSRGII